MDTNDVVFQICVNRADSVSICCTTVKHGCQGETTPFTFIQITTIMSCLGFEFLDTNVYRKHDNGVIGNIPFNNGINLL